ncbi:MAG: hypothetical protein R2724_21040 [Bryobacterales bacterium]
MTLGKGLIYGVCVAVGLAATSCGLPGSMEEVATESVRSDLRVLGESIYEAHARDGHWPASLEDLEGTAYLRMPERREALMEGVYVVLWPRGLDADPTRNADHVLAYHNAGLLAQGDRVWVCLGDLETVLMDAEDARAGDSEQARSLRP